MLFFTVKIDCSETNSSHKNHQKNQKIKHFLCSNDKIFFSYWNSPNSIFVYSFAKFLFEITFCADFLLIFLISNNKLVTFHSDFTLNLFNIETGIIDYQTQIAFEVIKISLSDQFIICIGHSFCILLDFTLKIIKKFKITVLGGFIDDIKFNSDHQNITHEIIINKQQVIIKSLFFNNNNYTFNCLKDISSCRFLSNNVLIVIFNDFTCSLYYLGFIDGVYIGIFIFYI